VADAVGGGLVRAAHWALTYFKAMDEANAAVHTGQVRYSPLTFRLAEALAGEEAESDTVRAVLKHRGEYEEDRGR
jgi:hypothetical protein